MPSQEYESTNSINCKYLDIVDFNSTFPAKSKSLSLLNYNISLLSKHFDNFNLLLDSLKLKFKIIGISETRILSSNHFFNYNIPNYSFLSTPTNSSAGGTALYISSDLTFKPRLDIDSKIYHNKLLESTFIELTPNKQCNIIVGCVYKHPSLPINDFNNLYLSPLLNLAKLEGKKIILLGDLNINLLQTSSDNHTSDFLDLLNSHLVLPTISLPTRITVNSQTLIDNIFISPLSGEFSSGNLTIGISDHLPQFLIIETQVNSNKSHNLYYHNWKSFNRENFILDFLEIDWNESLSLQDKNLDLSFSKFFNKLTHLINKHVPLKKLSKRKSTSKLKPWITSAIKKAIAKRNKLFKSFVNCKDSDQKSEYHTLYKFYRNRIVDLIRVSKDNYYKTFFKVNLNNAKSTWNGINELINLRNKNSANTISLNIDGVLESDPKLIGNNFNQYFTTIAGKIRKNIPKSRSNFKQTLKNSPQNSFFFSPISNSEVANIIKSLDPKKATGPNSLPNNILILLLNDISNILTNIFNLSLETGQFPTLLKTVKVIPVYKNKDSPFDACNYRPISLLSNIDKIFEKLVHTRIVKFLDKNKLIFNKQFGFRSKHSTSHALISLTEKIRKSIDEGKLSCGIFIDLQKAFDTVDHLILLEKLNHYGIRGLTNNWFKSYLCQRQQYVSISGINSDLMSIAHGVPQGSVLGPLLFLLYINDLPNAIPHSNIIPFADDTGFLHSHDNFIDLVSEMNNDLNKLRIWLNANKISLNLTKTVAILFKDPQKNVNHNITLMLGDQPLPLSSSTKYLGVIIDEHLNFHAHIDYISTKLSRANGILSKLRNIVPITTLRTLYYALFHSHISYATQVWGQKLSIYSRIFKLQKASVRILTFSDFQAHTQPLFKTLSIPTIFDLVFKLNIHLTFLTLNKLTPQSIQDIFNYSYLSNSNFTRGVSCKLLTKPTCRTTRYGINSILYQSLQHWNELQKHFNNIDLASIKLTRLYSLLDYFLSSESLTT